MKKHLGITIFMLFALIIVLFNIGVLGQNQNSVKKNLKNTLNLEKLPISFIEGSGLKKVYIIADPECVFCQILSTQLNNKFYKDHKVYFSLISINDKKLKNSYKMIKYIEDSKDPFNTYKKIDDYKDDYKEVEINKEFKEKIGKRKKNIEKEVSLSGTPTILVELSTGKFIKVNIEFFDMKGYFGEN